MWSIVLCLHGVVGWCCHLYSILSLQIRLHISQEWWNWWRKHFYRNHEMAKLHSHKFKSYIMLLFLVWFAFYSLIEAVFWKKSLYRVTKIHKPMYSPNWNFLDSADMLPPPLSEMVICENRTIFLLWVKSILKTIRGPSCFIADLFCSKCPFSCISNN